MSRVRARPVLPVPQRAPEPAQLELRAVRARCHRHGRCRAARERLPRTGGAVLRRDHAARLRPAAHRTSAPDTASTTSRTGRRPTPSTSTAPSTRARRSTSSSTTSRRCAAGMAPIAPEQETLLRAWAEHIVCAYWTHGGYLNWDTGYGFKRWHAGRTWALAQQGLLAIAVIPRFHHRARAGRVGEAQFDRGLALYERLSQAAADGKGIAPSNLYDVNVAPLGPSIRELFAARMQANAVRAVALGLGGDAGAGATASVLVRRRHRPPCRDDQALLDGRAARQPARLPVRRHGAVQVVRRRPAGRLERRRPALGKLRRAGTRSAGRRSRPRSARRRSRRCVPPLRLLSSPHGRVDLAQPYPPRPYAGPFETLIAHGPHGVRRGERRHDPPLHRGLDRDALGDRAPAARTLHRRCPVPLLGPDGARSRRSCAAGVA